MSLIAELKRRNVFRVGAVYLALGWVVTQVTGTMVPVLHLPEWTMPLIVWIGVIGFPFVMVFTWVYELTPEGLKREREVDRSASVTHMTARRLDYIIIGLLVLAAMLFGLDRFAPKRSESAVQATAADTSAARPVETQTAPAKTASPVTEAREKSIAVLPFVNMSGDPGNEYFSDGISEEILNVLARTPELHVAARTSSFAFRGKTQDIPQIARELQVRMVLEGSVRKQEDRVRITAQLIDAKTGFHVWSQSYDRKLADIFAIQDEIAGAIADELKVRITGVGESGMPDHGTENLEAYDLYLRGLALWQRRRDAELWQAIATFERAVEADPQFAQAYAGLALVYAVLPDYSLRIGYRDSYAKATDAAEMALALDASLPEPYAALASVAATEKRRVTERALYQRAIALRPSFATAHQWLGTGSMAGGDPVTGLASLERASALDPRSLVVGQNHAYVLTTLGRLDEARAICERILEFAPEYSNCHLQIGFGELLRGRPDAALPFLVRNAELDNPSALPLVTAMVEALDGRGDRQALARRLAAFPTRSYLERGSGNIFSTTETPPLLMLLDAPELALGYLERVAGEDISQPEWAMMQPSLDPIRCEPRFVALVKRLKTTDPRAPQLCRGKS